jgi:hypothetical protein
MNKKKIGYVLIIIFTALFLVNKNNLLGTFTIGRFLAILFLGGIIISNHLFKTKFSTDSLKVVFIFSMIFLCLLLIFLEGVYYV